MLTDHLGNTRVTFNQNGEVLQTDSYYPFGMSIESLSNTNNALENKYKYNGKEFQDDFNLDWHDYGARFYDAQIGRFHTLDPMAEKFYFQTTYCYAANNPIMFIDYNGENAWIPGTDGKKITSSSDKNGNLSVSANATKTTKRLVGLINDTGSKTAKEQFQKLSENETKVNLKIESKKIDNGYNGLHQPHGEDGEPLDWVGDEKGMFSDTPAYKTNADGKIIYEEATITIFEGNFKSKSDMIGVKIGTDDKYITASEVIVGYFSHEAEHNLNKKDIKAIKNRHNNKKNKRNVEKNPKKKAKKTFREIKNNRD